MNIQINRFCSTCFVNTLASNRIDSKKEAKQRNRIRQNKSENCLQDSVKGDIIEKNKMIKKSSGVYYSAPGNQRITREVINELGKIAEEESLDMVRLCLHESEESILMTMLIMIRNKYIYPIHRHTWKDESYMILHGECVYREYEENKLISKEVKLSAGDIMMNTSRTYHSIQPLTDMLCFVERHELA